MSMTPREIVHELNRHIEERQKLRSFITSLGFDLNIFDSVVNDMVEQHPIDPSLHSKRVEIEATNRTLPSL